MTLPLAGQHPANGGNPPHPQAQKANKAGQNPGRLGDWLRAHKDLPPDQQEKALENDPFFKRLTPQHQGQLKERLRKFNSLPPDKRDKALARMEYWDKLSPDERTKVRDANQQLQTLPVERRVMVHKALRHLRQMSPNERQQEFQSEKFTTTFSAQEQAILKNLAAINPPAAEGNPTPR
ncbi:MAG TPA: DUF3106 domain-containing protein [Candidatus Angelobacter sp.]